MIKREPTKKGDKVKVTFELPPDGSSPTFVVGDFNHWEAGATPLKKRGDRLVASLTLAAGRTYAFRYCHDGHWFNDDEADGYEANDYGDNNSILDLTDEAPTTD